MRLTVRTNLALRTLLYCAMHDGQTVQKRQIATCCNASEAHLGIVINQLSREGFVRTMRGRGGGICLAHTPEQISLGEVFRIFEEAESFADGWTACEDGTPLATTQTLRTSLNQALSAFLEVLDRVSLSDLIKADVTEPEQLLARAF